jgi:hypothetical protein
VSVSAPITAGTICVLDSSVEMPCAASASRRRCAWAATRARSASMPGSRSSAASTAPSTGGGRAVVKMKPLQRFTSQSISAREPAT